MLNVTGHARGKTRGQCVGYRLVEFFKHLCIKLQAFFEWDYVKAMASRRNVSSVTKWMRRDKQAVNNRLLLTTVFTYLMGPFSLNSHQLPLVVCCNFQLA